MKKNKKIYLKKIVAVLVLLSVLSSLLVVVSSASSVVPEDSPPADNTNVQVSPFFNPLGVTVHYAQANQLESYSFAFGGDFYADIPDLSAQKTYGYTSSVNVFANLNFITGEYSLRRYNDVSYYPFTNTFPNGYFTWGAQYYQSSIDTVLYNPYQTWRIADFVYSPVYSSYVMPFLKVGFKNNEYKPTETNIRYDFKINFYDDKALTLRTVEARFYSQGNYNASEDKFFVPLVSRDALNEQISYFCSEYGCSVPDYVSITEYECTWSSPGYDYTGAEVAQISNLSIHTLIDDRGAYPDMQDYSNWMLIKYQEEVTPPDSSDVSLWLVSGVKGFLDTPLFGTISIGMIFLSIFGFWFLIMFLKKFAGG